MSNAATDSDDRPSLLERVLGVITEVKPGEGVDALLMTLNIGLLLTAYYVIKPVREGLILAIEGGTEYKSYLAGVIALTLLLVVPAYGAVAKKLPRNQLVIGVTLFFASHLVLFRLIANVEAFQSWLGFFFFVWVGVFNMMVVAQFWAFANDIYVEEQGKRLFPLIGIGAASGAALGSQVTELLVVRLGTATMLLVSMALLCLCGVLTQFVHVRAKAKRASQQQTPPSEVKLSLKNTVVGTDGVALKKAIEAEKASEADKPIEAEKVKGEAEGSAKPKASSGAFSMVFKYRYLTLLAAFSLLFTFVNSNGEYILGVVIKAAAKEKIASGAMANVPLGDVISEMFANFFKWVNVITLVLQSLVVSRLVKYAGLKWTFLIFPFVAMVDAIMLTIAPVLLMVRIFKTAENAADYSINNTSRQMLWLPTTKTMKYVAKQAVDTFFIRMGDVAAAIMVALLAGWLQFGVRVFAALNIVLAVGTVFVCFAILKEQVVIKRLRDAGELPDDMPKG